ncbi:class I SAM-dependent methyltransferase [Achromobacter sp. ES-001]|uniref:class I SAM-dependent DNA methyltransferase n=1 Tax=Achromobacter sp. ES-001 TaxID=2860286 RepID=UPI001C640AD2|nr:class I SAM-dependent methyltransferase [Achromobacter sp. ES-001]QYJ21770.1 class I SAM-dependent methyltransferase [Achromobacter sp. ES-001]
MPSPADNVIAIYQDHAAAFEALRGTRLVELSWLTKFLSLMPVQNAQVLDIGCGNGVPIARHLIENGCLVTGIDTSLPLLSRAQSTFPDHQWIAADMRRLPFTQSFHGLIAWHSFFHLSPEDQRPMFSTFRRLAAPGAVLMFTSGTSLGEAIGQFETKPLYHGSLDPNEYRQLLNANGFSVKQHMEKDPACGGATVWLAQRDAAES